MILLQNSDSAPHMAMLTVSTSVSHYVKKGWPFNAGSVYVSTLIPVVHIRSVLTAVKERREETHQDIRTWNIDSQWVSIGPLTITDDPFADEIEGFNYLISLMEQVVANAESGPDENTQDTPHRRIVGQATDTNPNNSQHKGCHDDNQ